MDIRPFAPEHCAAWAEMLAAAFNRSAQEMAALLDWMCAGHEIVSFGAWDGEKLAAQYSCLIVNLELPGEPSPIQAGMSVNMATHPDYRGQGFIKRVARPVYETLTARGITAGVGFSNAAGVKVDKHSKGYGYRVVGQMIPLLTLVPFYKRGTPALILTDSLSRDLAFCPAASTNNKIRFRKTISSIYHRFACHPTRRYRFGLWQEKDEVHGIVVYRHTQPNGVSLIAAYTSEGCGLSELLMHWMYSLKGVRFIHTLMSPASSLRAALQQIAPCISVPYSRNPYYLTAKPLQTDTPANLFDLSAWDCTGGDIL